MGLGFHKHNDARGYFPKGGSNAPFAPGANPAFTTPQAREAEWSWAYQLLPYIEQDNLYKNTDSALVQNTPIKLFYCPSRRPAQQYSGTAKIDYAGNAGDRHDGDNGLVVQSTCGIVRLRDVTDGTSSTVMIGEKQMNRAMFGQTADDNESYCTPGWNGDWEVYRRGHAGPARDFNLPGDTNASQVFGSSHPTGFTCVFGDGSVRYIRYSVDPTVWRRACVRNDSQPISLNDL
jgi:hypothetical protein